MYYLQPLFSDVTFKAEGTLVHSHKLVLCTRCDVMSSMLTGGSQINTVSMKVLDVVQNSALAKMYSRHKGVT